MNTPERINGPWELPANSVFVFGSNTQGIHGTGSARTARDHFGAIYGEPHGRQGSSYAICTTDLQSDDLYPLALIENHIVEFLYHASEHPDEVFWVTKVGTQRAGYSVEDIGELWKSKWIPANVRLPEEFKR